MDQHHRNQRSLSNLTNVNDSPKHPAIRCEITESFLQESPNSTAFSPRSQLKETGVRDIPTAVNPSNLSENDRELVSDQQRAETPQSGCSQITPSLSCSSHLLSN